MSMQGQHERLSPTGTSNATGSLPGLQAAVPELNCHESKFPFGRAAATFRVTL